VVVTLLLLLLLLLRISGMRNGLWCRVWL